MALSARLVHEWELLSATDWGVARREPTTQAYDCYWQHVCTSFFSFDMALEWKREQYGEVSECQLENVVTYAAELG